MYTSNTKCIFGTKLLPPMQKFSGAAAAFYIRVRKPSGPLSILPKCLVKITTDEEPPVQPDVPEDVAERPSSQSKLLRAICSSCTANCRNIYLNPNQAQTPTLLGNFILFYLHFLYRLASFHNRCNINKQLRVVKS